MEVKSVQGSTAFMTETEDEYKPSNSDCEEEDAESASASVDNSDSWDEEDNSEDSVTEDMGVFEERFRTLIDRKVKVAETFCDHQLYLLSFAPPPPPENPAPEPVPPVSPTPTDVESEIDIAREEIAKLRIARDVFVTHRTEVGVRLKMEESETDARWLYECEEAVDALDTIIDYKNEIICGRQDTVPQLFPDRADESDLMMTRLVNLSSSEQYRLFCKFFNKDVELRYSTKQLERTIDQVQNDNEEIIEYYNKHIRKRLRKQDEAVAALFTSTKASPTGRNAEGERHHRHHHRDEQGPSSSSRRQRIFLKDGRH